MGTSGASVRPPSSMPSTTAQTPSHVIVNRYRICAGFGAGPKVPTGGARQGGRQRPPSLPGEGFLPLEDGVATGPLPLFDAKAPDDHCCMSASTSCEGFGPDDSLTPESLEELLEGPGTATDQELHVQNTLEETVDLLEGADALVDNGLEFLTEAECHQLLSRTWIGRVGVSIAGVATIFPVRYAMVGDDVVFFTGEGAKLDAATRGKTLTFEIDSYDPRRNAGWSVLVVGTAEEITRPDLYGRRAETLHSAAPGVRNHIVRIRTDVVTGRRFGPGCGFRTA